MAINNVTTNTKPEKGINYTVIIDNINDDFGDVNNNTYFLDKETQLVYYKNSTGGLVSIFEQGGSGNTIYSADDSLTDNRTVDLLTHTLTLDGTGETGNSSLKILGGNQHNALEVRGNSDSDFFELYSSNLGSGKMKLFGEARFGFQSGGDQGFIIKNNADQMEWRNSSGMKHEIRLSGGGTGVFFHRNGVDKFIVGGTAPIESEKISLQGDTLISEKLELSSKEHGILFNRVDSSEMDAISAEPDEVVYNTQLNALYRWDDGLSVWIALAAGYGPISLTDSAGNPTFYADLPSAFSVASSGDVINLHTNITVTSTCLIPDVVGASITLNGNGHTITHESNTGSEFVLIHPPAADSKIYLNDIKIISNGTGTDDTKAIFDRIPNIYANNNTFIKSINNNCSYISGIDGGNWESINNHVAFSGTIKNAVVKFKYSRSPFVNCDITIASGGKLAAAGNAGGDLINCIITGESTTASSMIVANDQNKIHGCKITCIGGPNSAIVYSSGNYTYKDVNPVPFQDNIIYHYGTGGYAVKATYTAVFKDSYIFSKDTSAMYTQNTSQVGGYNLENIILETDSATNNAFYRLDGGTLRMKNVSATNINPINTQEAFNIRISSVNELYMENCSANVNNPTVDNIKLNNNVITTGGAYIYGLIMSKIGNGLNLNTVPLLNSNTADDYGNLKIG